MLVARLHSLKALLHVARVISEVEELGADWGVSYDVPKIDVDKIRANVLEVDDVTWDGAQKDFETYLESFKITYEEK